MNRLESLVQSKRQNGQKILAMFLTAGYPRKTDTFDQVIALERGGVDIIELGMPFSDPLADGPVIQESSAVALKNGVTLSSIFTEVMRIRRRSQIPIVLMGYLNPILHYGEEEFFDQAASSGVDGIILPEVPLEEYDRFAAHIQRYALSGILLVAPTTPPERISQIDRRSRGFVYCVSSTGVTGKKSGTPATEYLESVRRNVTNNAVLVGFGISTPEEARQVVWSADGVIVGSALIRYLATNPSLQELTAWAGGFRTLLNL